MIIKLKKSNDKKHKYIVEIDGKNIKFGAYGYSDYTIHKDKERKKRYIARHSKMGEDWNKSGLLTRGFWARWLLWNKPDLMESIKDTEERFNINIIYHGLK
jgi:hypothetical protein